MQTPSKLPLSPQMPRTPLPSSSSSQAPATPLSPRGAAAGADGPPSPSSASASGAADTSASGSRRFSAKYKTLRAITNAAIILDIGEAYIKCGFAGDPAPRHIIPTEFITSSGEKVSCALSRGARALPQVEWERALNRLLRLLYTQYLQVQLKSRRVIVCENPFWPVPFKKALTKVAFNLGIPWLKFLNTTSLPLYVVQKPHGVIIDIGYAETRVICVYEGFPLLASLKSMPLGMKDIGQSLLSLSRKGKDDEKKQATTPRGSLVFPVAPQDAENIVAMSCYVRRLPPSRVTQVNKLVAEEGGNEIKQKEAADGHEQKWAPIVGAESPAPAAFTFRVNNAIAVDITGDARHQAADVLFGDNSEMFSIADLVLESLMQCSTEVRGTVTESLIIVGGTASLPGLARRLLEELDLSLTRPKYRILRALRSKFYVSPVEFPPSIMSWLGASIVGSFELPDRMFISKEKYDAKEQTVRDWTFTVRAAADGKDGTEEAKEEPEPSRDDDETTY